MPLLDQYAGTWGDAEVSHLLGRTAFGASKSDRTAYGAMTLADAVAALVDFPAADSYLDGATAGGGAVHGAPFIDLPTVAPAENDPNFVALRDLYEVNTHQFENRLRGHWLYRMRYSAEPFREQIALFLHDHAPSGIEKIQDTIPNSVNLGNDGDPGGLLPMGETQPCTSGTLPYDPYRQHGMAVASLYDQCNLYRTEGVNNFESLLLALARSSAMLIYLDNYLNIKGKPQENFAREVLELFSLGVGNYSELDIFQIAKCVTGESFLNFSCPNDYDTTSGFIAGYHEPGNKTVFGQTVTEDMTGQETVNVVNLIVNKNMGLDPPYSHLPATAVHIAWKMVTWFVDYDASLNPPDPLVLELADYLIGDDASAYPSRRYPYDVKAALGKLFRSQVFYDSANRLNMYKNPADFTIGALKALDANELMSLSGVGEGAMEKMVRDMGMRLYEPPDVSGWLHGKSWLSSSALIARYNFANQVDTWMLQYYSSGQAWLDALPPAYDDHAGMISHITDLLLPQGVTAAETTELTNFLNGLPVGDISGNQTLQKRRKIASLVHVILTMPAYQLK